MQEKDFQYLFSVPGNLAQLSDSSIAMLTSWTNPNVPAAGHFPSVWPNSKRWSRS
jgi:hypothetical protein